LEPIARRNFPHGNERARISFLPLAALTWGGMTNKWKPSRPVSDCSATGRQEAARWDNQNLGDL
jgi:hypothetical protein